ncbi:T9SS type A sorting domain-containing protein [uncultured Aquimarina sp.]|uniref:T9SS type A sorting domain-containing protein n=1 Tax=uncultured Aquimarina sp. TaxID=575652 RepID=UPI002628FEAE|nr:T9SS type A sorting domain-containing protein [uncultured Aquimarina sp.]
MRRTLLSLFLLFSSYIFAQNIDYESRITSFYANDNNEFGEEEYAWLGWIRDNVNTVETASGCVAKSSSSAATQTGNYAVRNQSNTAATEIIGRIDAWEDDSVIDDNCVYGSGDDSRLQTSGNYSFVNPIEDVFTTANQTIGSNSFNMNLFYQYKYANTTIANAVENTTETFTTGGTKPFWGSNGAWSNDGTDAATSGTITDNQISSFSTTVSGKSQVIFDWRVSSEANDFLQVYVNGVLDEQISGNVAWATKTINLTAYTNTIEWRYSKDGTGSALEDRGHIDTISFTNATPLTISAINEFSTTNGIGEKATFTVTFNQNVDVDLTGGTPSLSLGLTPSGMRQASYATGTGTSTLTFEYTVVALDPESQLTLTFMGTNGGSIVSSSNNVPANLNYSFPITTNTYIDGIIPAISNAVISTDSANQSGRKAAGDNVIITVNFPEIVINNSFQGYIPFTIDGETRTASFTEVSGTTAIFNYSIVAGENGPVSVLDTDIITATSGSLDDVAGNSYADTAFNSVSGIVIVDTTPIILSTTLSGSDTNIVIDGESIIVTVTFSEDLIDNSFMGSVPLTIGGVSRTASFISVSGSTATFEYVVAAGENGTVSVLNTNAITITTGSLEDNLGNQYAGASFNSVSGMVIVDTIPIIRFVSVSSDSAIPGLALEGDKIRISAVFSEPATDNSFVGHIPFKIGGVSRSADYIFLSGSLIEFEYQIVSGDNGPVVVLGTDSIVITTGSLNDANGNSYVDAPISSVSGASIIVDTESPSINNLLISSSSSTQPANAGRIIKLKATFSEDVTNNSFTGTVPFTIGGVSKIASFNGLLSATEAEFVYTVVSGDNGIVMALPADNINITNGLLLDNVGNPYVDASFSSVTGSVLVDTTAPSIDSALISSNSSIPGTAIEGDNIIIRVTFAENIAEDGFNGSIPFTIGGIPRVANYNEFESSTEIDFTYTVLSGDSGLIAVSDIDNITITSGSLEDAAGNLYIDAPFSSITGTVTVDNTTLSANDYVGFQNIVLYPNPTEGMVSINNNEILKVTVFNITGQKVWESFKNNFDTSTLKSGVYFVNIETEKGSIIKRLIRK